MQGNLGAQLSLNGSNIELDEQFKSALSLMENTNDNLLITGRAGTGKSTLLECFRSITKKDIAILAPTGVAALNVKGQTIHSFFRFKPDITIDTVKKLHQYQGQIYAHIDALIIDEVSMVRADLFDCMDAFMRKNGKDHSLPFGGVQLILVGDLYQLPPIVTKDEEGMFSSHYKSQYFFDSNSFNSLNMHFIELQKHRRQTDPYFIELLNAIRENKITEEQLAVLNLRLKPGFVPDSSKTYVYLTTTNRVADGINEEALARLRAAQHTYAAEIEGDFDKKTMPADELLKVKEGMQVMMLNNDKLEQWVNGSVGKVIGVRPDPGGKDVISVRLNDGMEVSVNPHTWEMFRFSYDPIAHKLLPKKVGSFTQYPIAPAWAVTVHKSQGKTFKDVVIDISGGTFANGQLYVALSRCTTLHGITLRQEIERRHIMTDQRVVDFLRTAKLDKGYKGNKRLQK